MIVPIQLDLHKSDLQTKLAPNFPQSIGSKDETSSPDEFYLNVIFWYMLIGFGKKKKKVFRVIIAR